MSLSALERFDTHNGDSITELVFNVALGQVPGAETVYIIGHNPAIQTGVNGLMWPLDGTLAQSGVFPTLAGQYYVTSSSLADIGMTIRLIVLDSNYNVQKIGVSLNGQTAVALPILIRRVILAENVGATPFAGVVYVGTEAVPVAGVPARINTIEVIEPDDQISHSATYTVPLGKTLFIYEFAGGTPTNDAVDISGYYSNPGTTVFKKGSHLPVYRGFATQAVSFFLLPEKTDIYLAALAYTNNTIATGHLLGILVDNKYVKN